MRPTWYAPWPRSPDAVTSNAAPSRFTGVLTVAQHWLRLRSNTTTNNQRRSMCCLPALTRRHWRRSSIVTNPCTTPGWSFGQQRHGPSQPTKRCVLTPIWIMCWCAANTPPVMAVRPPSSAWSLRPCSRRLSSAWGWRTLGCWAKPRAKPWSTTRSITPTTTPRCR